MEHDVQPVNSYSPQRLSGYFDAFVQSTQAVYPQDNWMATLSCLRDQRGYLESLLSKTATTLNALRDRQDKNEWALNANPTPRTKKKKIQQNRWRTNRTIQRCENEEKVILECLQVCNSNISTLESILLPIDSSSTAAEYNSHGTYLESYLETDSTATGIDWNGWNGWVDGGETSPFQRRCNKPLMVDDIPPEEAFLERSMSCRKLPPLPPRAALAVPLSTSLPPAPPKSAYIQFHHSMLSPEATCFESKVLHVNGGAKSPCGETLRLDKLSISGLMASKRVQAMMHQRRRFSDAAIGHMFRKLSTMSRPGVVARQSSCPPLGRQREEDGPGRGGLKRHSSL
ncbi:hypothetical protein B0J11DRAFT_503921 [Dendryphion nanum]|uniref:Uncharacterized protein n=1 Tax=Dendryphion nanum TaxID=256645 RepID=A0A9P9E538_9PLEO|nr:hypothetical protein B0J11DRAFT_503921 [Dendryphion nanum]